LLLCLRCPFFFLFLFPVLYPPLLVQAMQFRTNSIKGAKCVSLLSMIFFFSAPAAHSGLRGCGPFLIFFLPSSSPCRTPQNLLITLFFFFSSRHTGTTADMFTSPLCNQSLLSQVLFALFYACPHKRKVFQPLSPPDILRCINCDAWRGVLNDEPAFLVGSFLLACLFRSRFHSLNT